MQPGQQVLGRFLLQAPLPAAPDQLRWAAVDRSSGAEVEVVAPSGRVALRPGATDRFAAACSIKAAGATDALLPFLAHGVEGGRPVAVRPRTRGPLDPAVRLEADTAWEWARWLAPAVARASGAVGGELSPSDLVVDEHGVLRLSPAGLVPARSEARPPRFRAPGVLRGAAPQPGDGLYGLGVLLFHALSGAWPVDAATAAGLRSAGPPRSLAALRPDIDPALVALVDALLDDDPRRRLEAVAALPERAPVHARPLPTSSPSSHSTARAATGSAVPGPPAVRTTRQAPPPRRGRPDRPLADWVVLAEAAELTQAARTRAAALLGVPPDVIATLAETGLPVPLGEAPSRGAATERAAALRVQAIPARPERHGAPQGATARAVISGLGAAGSLGLLVLALLFTSLLGALALPIAAALGALGIMLTVVAAGSARQAARRRRVERARKAIDSAPPPVASNPVARLSSALREIRAEILHAGLPAVVRIDLEGAADEIDARLDELRAAWERDRKQAEVREAVDQLTPLVEMLGEAVRSQVQLPSPDEELRDEVRRRAQAARAALRQGG